jgi:glutamine amidotransferase-like uncharacterized protein
MVATLVLEASAEMRESSSLSSRTKISRSMKQMALYLHHPECSKDCVYAMVNALSSDYQIRIFEERELDDDNFFDSIDIIAFPGGIGDSDSYPNFFTRRRANRIAQFISGGGHYLGICMGAYWAGSRYFDILDSVEPEQYIKRPNTTVRRSYGTVTEVDWNGTKEQMYFYDGCAFIGDETKFKTIARYANGDPMAIIQGRIGLIGCHPEAPKYWYEKPWQYIEKHWNNGRHHELLLSFVNEVCSKVAQR